MCILRSDEKILLDETFVIVRATNPVLDARKPAGSEPGGPQSVMAPVRVTVYATRVVVNGSTTPLADVSSVRVEDVPANSDEGTDAPEGQRAHGSPSGISWWVNSGISFVGFLLIDTLLNAVVDSFSKHFPFLVSFPVQLVSLGVLAGVGAWLMLRNRSPIATVPTPSRKAHTSPPIFRILVLDAAGNQRSVLRSTSMSDIDIIVTAINQAIIHR